MQIASNIIKIIFSISLPVILGYVICEAFLSKKSSVGFTQKLSLSYGAGMGAVSLVMFLLSLLKIKFSFFSITLSLLIVAMPFLLALFRPNTRLAKSPGSERKPLSFSQKFLIGVIVFVCSFVLFQALITPLTAWDSWAIFGFKAKAFFVDNAVHVGFLKDPTKSYSHPDYPLLLPLTEAWIYICLGAWNDQLVKILFPLYFIGSIIIFYNNLKYYIGKKYSLLFAVFLVTIPQFVSLGSSGYADLPLAFYYFTSLVFLIRGCDDFDKALLYVSAIFAGLAAWTKNEGIVMAIFDIIIFIGAVLVKRKLNRKNILLIAQYGLIIALIAGPWVWFKNSLGLSNVIVNSGSLNTANIFNNLNRLPLILIAFAKEIFSFRSWNLLWIFSIVIVIFNFKKIISAHALIMLLSITFYLTVWIFVYIITPLNINWHLATSLNRSLLHIVLLVLFLDGLLIGLPRSKKI